MPDGASKLSDAVPSDALKDAGQKLLSMLVQRAAEAATDRVAGLTDRLTDVGETGSGLKSAITGSRDDEDDEDRDPDSEDSGGGFFSGLKDKVTGLFGGGSDSGGGGGKGGKKLKVTQIVEDLDVGLPLRTTYDLWTQFGDFPSFMKKVESVDQVSDEKTQWKAQIFLSHREWEATILEQVPDSHIVWKSKGAKGHVDGAVSFTELGPNATRVLLVLEYFPQGLFERTGNIWRAQGRRARLEFKHFRRHAMATVLLHPDDVEGWRGEIHEGEVTRTHEEALEEEERQRAEEGAEEDADGLADEARADEYDGDDGAEDSADDSAEDAQDGEYDSGEDADYDESDEADEYEDDPTDDPAEDDEPSEEVDEYDDMDDAEDTDDADEYEDDADEDDEPADDAEYEEPEAEPAPRRRRSARRQPATAGGRSR